MDFCSRASIAAHETFAGTGVRGDAYVFLPVPKRVWHDREMNSHWASREELEALRAARKGGVVVRLYNPPEREADEAAVLVHRPATGEPEGLAALVELFARRWPIDATGAPRLAICTHGTRDRCCAKFGFAAYRTALKLFESGASPFQPIESSHLGGDRFAATGIFFPSGSMYAHLDETGLETLCAAEAEGRLDPAFYRGGVFDTQLTQLVRAGLARQGLVNDTRQAITVTSQGPADAEAVVGERRYRVWLRTAEVEFYGSCSALHASKRSHGRRACFERAEPL